jgi:hypothetical protein
MSLGNLPGYIQTLQNWVASINNAAGQTKQTIATGATNGSRILGLIVSSTDTSARDIVIGVTISATNYDLGIVSIPAQSGTLDTVPTVFPFKTTQFPYLPVDAYGNPYLDIKSTTTFYAYAPVTVTSAKQINLFAFGGDF